MTATLAGTTEPLQAHYDALLLDLDGTLHRGPDPVAGAAEAMTAARAAGRRLAFVTNNASRTPNQVVLHLLGVGITADEGEVLTSAQAGARALARLVPPGSAVLVVGGDGLTAAVVAEGLRPVGSAADEPAGVVQGWFGGLSWPVLAEGAYALATGVPWVATNVDLTLPTSRGVAPGNGSFVRLLAGVSGREPDVVAGKPGPLMLLEAAGADGRKALVVGDRLDTDIAGAVAAGLDSLLVLTGVTDVAGLLAAEPHQRPTYVSRDLTGLTEIHPWVAADGADAWSCNEARVVWNGGVLSAADVGEPDDLLRALCVAVWSCAGSGRSASVDDAALAAVQAAD